MIFVIIDRFVARDVAGCLRHALARVRVGRGVERFRNVCVGRVGDEAVEGHDVFRVARRDSDLCVGGRCCLEDARFDRERAGLAVIHNGRITCRQCGGEGDAAGGVGCEGDGVSRRVPRERVAAAAREGLSGRAAFCRPSCGRG